MKKIIASITIFCYLVVTCGVIVNAHYCMNQLSSVHLFELKSEKCDLCGMDIHKSKGCCRDEVSVIKLVQDQNKIPVVSYDLNSPELFAITVSEFIVSPFTNPDINTQNNFRPPPLLSRQDSYLQNSVFRI